MKTLLSLLVLFAAACVFGLLVYFQPEANEVAPERPITAVETITVQPQTVQLTVRSQGTVLPQIEIDLFAEVSGRVIRVSKNFRVGASFNKGDVLLQIDPVDYEAAVAAREAELANAKLQLAQETALSEQAADDWKALGEGQASPLTLREPQLEQAQANLKNAQAQLAQAQRNLERAALIAPFDGRILSKFADLGQYIAAGPSSPLASIYSTDTAEIRLPVTQREANFLNLNTPSTITLIQPNQVNAPEWTAQLDRLEANIDTKSRLTYAVATIEDFEAKDLRRGRFVEATIQGSQIEGAYTLPRYALRGSDTVYILTGAQQLQTRTVKVLKSDPKQVIITEGLQPGDQVAISPIAYFVENMPVTLID